MSISPLLKQDTCDKHKHCIVTFDITPEGCPLCRADNILEEASKQRDELEEKIEKLEEEISDNAV